MIHATKKMNLGDMTVTGGVAFDGWETGHINWALNTKEVSQGRIWGMNIRGKRTTVELP